MTDDFKDMAAKAKADFENRARKEREHRAVEREGRAKEVDRAVNLLRTQILPLLEEAKAAFQISDGIEAKITLDFDVKNFVSRPPAVRFSCLGPARASDGYRFETPDAEFSANGEEITVKYPKELGAAERPTHTSHDSVVVQKLVHSAVKEVLNSYYRHLEEHRQSGAPIRCLSRFDFGAEKSKKTA